MPRLVIRNGPNKDQTIALAAPVILGRGGRSTPRIEDDRASVEHARVYVSGGACFVVDLNSKNGTFLNGRRVTKASLNPGDEIQIGETYVRFEGDEVAMPADGGSDEIQLEGAGAEEPVVPAGRSVFESRGPAIRSVNEIRLDRDKPIQFSPHAQKTRTSFTWLRQDLAQRSAWFKLLIFFGIAVAAVGIFVLALSLTRGK